MRKPIQLVLISLTFAAFSCGGGGDQKAPAVPKSVPAFETLGPLGVGAGYESWTKVNKTPSDCTDHGGRLCDFYVNDVGLEAYKNESAEIPAGTIVVKPSWEKNADGTAGDPGPIFVMEKRADEFAEHSNWYYAIHWEKISAKWASKIKAPFYFQSPSKKIGYCQGCHDGYDRQLGMVPEENRADNW